MTQTIKETAVELGQLARQCDHSAEGVKALHDALWAAAWRHREALGLTEADLSEIGGANEAARGGGTGKTPPNED